MDQTNPVASSSNSKKIVDETLSQVTTDHSNAENDLSDCEEIVVEETFIQVTPDNPDEMSDLNENSNVRLIAIDSDAPALQIENKVAFYIYQIVFTIIIKYLHKLEKNMFDFEIK